MKIGKKCAGLYKYINGIENFNTEFMDISIQFLLCTRHCTWLDSTPVKKMKKVVDKELLLW